MEDQKSVLFQAAKCLGYNSVKDLQYEVIDEIDGGSFQTFKIRSRTLLLSPLYN